MNDFTADGDRGCQKVYLRDEETDKQQRYQDRDSGRVRVFVIEEGQKKSARVYGEKRSNGGDQPEADASKADEW